MKPQTVLQWTAHVLGVASTMLLLAFAFGGHESMSLTGREAVLFLFFPVGIIAGFILAWRRELLGGLFTVGSLALFYGYIFAQTGRIPGGPYFLLFALPGFLHIASAMLPKWRSAS